MCRVNLDGTCLHADAEVSAEMETLSELRTASEMSNYSCKYTTNTAAAAGDRCGTS